MIERDKTRAVQGGCGAAKTGGNYAQSVLATAQAQEKGYHQVLWLDAVEKQYVEELSAMNFFAVIDGAIVTPTLTDSILAGITRDSLLTLGKHLGLEVSEERIGIDKLIKYIESGWCTELFACGTAAIIAPIGHIGEANGQGVDLPRPYGPIAQKLRDTLLKMQSGLVTPIDGWMRKID